MALIRINLLPRNLRKRVEPGWWRVLAAGVPLLALVVMGALQVSSQNELSNVSSEIVENQRIIDSLQDEIALQRSLVAEQASLQSIISTARSLQQPGSRWSADLARFTSRIPTIGDGSTIALTSLTMAVPTKVFPGKTVVREFTLAGKARSSAALSSFIRTFEENSDTAIAFQNATKDTSSNPETGATNSDWTFSATVGLAPEATPVAASTPADSSTPSTGTDSGTQVAPIAPSAPASGGN